MHAKSFFDKIKSSSSSWILVSKKLSFDNIYKRIVELWCHAKNFPNDPHTLYESLKARNAYIFQRFIFYEQLK